MMLALLFVPAALAAVKGGTSHEKASERRHILLTLKQIQQEVGECMFRTTMSGYNARLNVGLMMALSNKTETQRFCCECTTMINIRRYKDRYYRRVLLGHNERNTYKLAQRLLGDYTFHENRDIVEVGCGQEGRGLHSIFGLDRKVYCVFRPYRPKTVPSAPLRPKIVPTPAPRHKVVPSAPPYESKIVVPSAPPLEE